MKNEKEENIAEERPVRSVRRRINFGRLFLALIFILLGGFFLARNMGWISGDIVFDWNWVWPLLIIFFGLSLLDSDGWLAILIGVIGTAAVVGVIAYALIFAEQSPQAQSERQEIKVERQSGVTAAVIDINAGAGNLTIGADSQAVLSGDIRSSFLSADIKSTTSGGVQTVTLNETGRVRTGFRRVNDLDLNIIRTIPVEVQIDSGAMDMNMDMSDLQLRRLDVNTGASSMSLELGDKVSESTVRVKAGASSVKLLLPQTVGVKMDVETGLSSKDIEGFTKVDGDTYETANYNTAAKKINIDMTLGVSSLDVDFK